MKIEIDQSGKIEETHRDTVLAFTNGIIKSVLITARTKRRLQDLFRKIGQPKTFVINIFASAIYLLVKDDLKNISKIIIDVEYPGYEKIVIRILRKILQIKRIKNDPIITFKLLGKRSKAHKKAIKVFRKKEKANQALSYDLLFKENVVTKNGYPALKYPAN